MIQVFAEDPCCESAFADALLSGDLDGKDVWTHEDCGQEWRAVMVDGVKSWTPHIWVEVICST
jgi:hypothetical protein